MPLGVQRGGVGVGVGDGPVGYGVAAAQGKSLADVDHLGDNAGGCDVMAGAHVHVGVDPCRDADLIAGLGGVHRRLRVVEAGRLTAAISAERDVDGASLGLSVMLQQGEAQE